MTKNEAIELFGSISSMAEALEISRQTVHNWGDNLSQKQVDRVRGAFMRYSLERTEREQEILDNSFVRKYTGIPNKVKE